MEAKMETKKCIHCDTIKTIDLFYMHGKQIRNVCKECQKIQQRLYYEQNKEEILEDKKEYREAIRELILQQKRRYHELNREKIREKAREYTKTEHAKQIASKYKDEHKEELEEKLEERLKTKYICECGFELSVAGKYKHQKTLHHRTYLLNK